MKQPLQKDDVVKGYDTEGDIKEVIEIVKIDHTDQRELLVRQDVRSICPGRQRNRN